MEYSSYINMGNSYADSYNYFNAIQAYNRAINLQKRIVYGLYNISTVYSEIGLENQSLKYVDNCIEYNLKHKSNLYVIDSHYTHRAMLYRKLGNESKMNEDLESAFKIKPNLQFGFLQKAKLYTKKGEFDKAEEYYNKCKERFLYSRALYFLALELLDKYLLDCIEKNNKSQLKSSSLYELGKAYYLNNNYKKAEECYNQFISKGNYLPFYKDSINNYGVIQEFDELKKNGYIFGKSIYSNYDKIYFNFKDFTNKPKLGDTVKYLCKYRMYNNQFLPYAVKIKVDYKINDLRFKKVNTYHAIINVKANAFNANEKLKYIEIFYPYKKILPISILKDKLDENIIDDLEKFGFSFVEIFINIDNENNIDIKYLKKIKTENQYNNKVFSQNSYYENKMSKITNSFDLFGKTCYSCGMDCWCGTDGCPNDPT